MEIEPREIWRQSFVNLLGAKDKLFKVPPDIQFKFYFLSKISLSQKSQSEMHAIAIMGLKLCFGKAGLGPPRVLIALYSPKARQTF